jgi:purine-binding chemotaxis protein CheW
VKEQQNYEIERVLQEMRDEYWRGLEEGGESAAVESRDYVVFLLGGERYALPATVAREVLRLPRLVRVPRVAVHIRGVINLRGQIVAVTDLRPLLGLAGAETPATAQLIVVEAAGLVTALLTDRVEGIRTLDISAIEPMTEGLSGFPRDAIEGQVGGDDGLLVLLDLANILARPEFVIDQKGE